MLQKETLQFFRELRENNHKEWFDVNRKRYEVAKKDYHSLVQKMIDTMQVYDPRLANLEIKNCTFRINRDIRFSKDKSPYKTHLAILLSPDGKKMDGAGYYLHLDENGGCFIAGGIYMPPADLVKKMRAEILGYYEELDAVFANPKFKKVFPTWDKEAKLTLSRAPKGIDEDHPAIEHLKLKSYTVTHDLPSSILTDPKGVEKVSEKLALLKPLLDFVNRALKEN
jgi:uncharacterized protein (TIGR02453 family)